MSTAPPPTRARPRVRWCPGLMALIVAAAASDGWTVHAYLIVAMPKSGSTALMTTLGAATRTNSTQLYPCEWLQDKLRASFVHGRAAAKSAEDFIYLSLPHTDTCSWNMERLAGLVKSRDTIYKQHLTPTPSNIAVLGAALREDRGARVVLLLRNALDAAAAYTRHAPLIHKFETYPRPKQDLEEAALDKLAALQRFSERWLAFAEMVGRESPGRILVVHTPDLIREPDRHVRRVVSHFGLELTRRQRNSTITLKKEMYSHGNSSSSGGVN